MAMGPVNGDELWRDCSAWLTRWDVLRSDHRANWPTAGIVDLANTLRDGVLLCNLLNKMDPGCIDTKNINLKPAMAQFLCLRNIDVFRDTCVSTFGLKHSDLFEPLMLFDLTNFHKVLCTLSKLSLSPKATRHNAGFSVQTVSREEEDIYQSLKSVEPRLRSTLDEEQIDDYYEDYGSGSFHRQEEIYQDLCSLQRGRQAEFVITQPPLEQRDYVIKEMIDTEHNYVDVLQKLKKVFMRPLLSLLAPEAHSTIFCKIIELHEIHTGFLSQLLKVGTDPSVRLSEIFMTWRERFLVYGHYCANLSNACTVLQDICDKNPLINQAIIKYEQEYNSGKFKLRDVLSVPMQRILKYHLLLEKLIQSTDPNHDELKDLKRAREAMLDVAGYINESARDSEHLAVIKKVAENIIGCDSTDLENYGRLIKDGELKIKGHNDQKNRARYVFIFDRVMILCKQLNKGNQFEYRDMLKLSEYQVDDYHNRPVLNREARWSYSWLLVKEDRSMAYTLLARSIELKSKMIKAIKDAMDNIKPTALSKTNHKFEMHSFDKHKPVTCHRCSKYLRGLIYQGYICRVCDIAVHKECIAKSGRCGVPPPPRHYSISNDAHLNDKLWFVGEMDRNDASMALEKRCNGTYLVRIRSQRDDGRFALSLKTDGTVKHMKICCNLNGSEEKYFLSLSKYFNSIQELIENYQHSSLKENFERLEEHTRLEWPYRLLRAIAVRDFDSQDPSHLHLRDGCQVIVVGQEGYRDGWWKGKCDSEIGYFPKNYVEVKEEIVTEEIVTEEVS